tara:strand:+ start:70 stop:1344 length:1275 start_codon:yes stop_codon:yes gene_type:complete
MKINLKEINSFTKELEVSVTWDSIQNEYQEEYIKTRKNYSIPGFRKGKVPHQIVKQKLGASIEINFAENSINKYYREALKELEVIPINQATISNLSFKEGSDLSFTAQFEIEPNIKLPKYQNNIKVSAIKYLTEEEDIEQTLNQYQEQHANIKTIETGAKSGHFIRGDFQILFDNGDPKIGSKLENQHIRLGFGLFKNEQEKVFIGCKKGDKIRVSIPQGNDKIVNYEVTILRVEEQLLPDLNDELAKQINKDVKDLASLKEVVKKQIQDSFDQEHNKLVNKEIMNYFVDKTKIDAPLSMVNRYIEHIKEDLVNRKQPFEEDKVNEEYKEQAEWNIKWYLIKGRLLKEESLNVSKEEVDKKITGIISSNKGNEEQITSYFSQPDNKQRVFDEMLNEKLFNKLIEYSKIKVIEKSSNQLRKQTDK